MTVSMDRLGTEAQRSHYDIAEHAEGGPTAHEFDRPQVSTLGTEAVKVSFRALNGPISHRNLPDQAQEGLETFPYV